MTRLEGEKERGIKAGQYDESDNFVVRFVFLFHPHTERERAFALRETKLKRKHHTGHTKQPKTRTFLYWKEEEDDDDER